MKAFFRSRAMIGFGASLFAGYLRLTYATLRWTIEGAERADAVKANIGRGSILCFWHARIPMSPCTWSHKEPKTIHALISKSSDGEFITQTVLRLGFPAVRGSRADEDSTGDKGGSGAFRAMTRWIKAGNAMAITPDGPKGPAEVMGEGTPLLARMTGAEVVLAGVAVKPCIRLKTWDQTVFPLPFAKAAIVWDGPLTSTREDDPVAQAAEWGARLKAATDRAEALVA